MKIIVTHSSPDMDAITSVWLIKKFLQGWENAEVRFVPAGERLRGLSQESARGPAARFPPASAPSPSSQMRAVGSPSSRVTPRLESVVSPVEIIEDNQVIHVDTGMGPLDHHQTSDENVCAASLTFDYVKGVESSKLKVQSSQKGKDRMEAVSRMVKVVVDIDHFKEVFRKDPLADYHDFDLAAILDGLKFQFPNSDDYYVEFVSKSLDAILHEFENRIWAEKEIRENGVEFKTRIGRGIGFETINDSVIKLAQKMGYIVVLRKDPRKGYIRIKAKPFSETRNSKHETRNKNIDLTLVYEKLKKMDPEATWFLHVSKKMLLNGSVKNPKMRPTRLGLSDIIKVLEKI